MRIGWGSRTWVLVGATAAFLFAGVAAAAATPVFSQITPAPNTTVTVSDPTVSAYVTDTNIIGRATATIDGLYYGTPTLVPTVVNGVRDYTKVTVLLALPSIADGPHAVILNVYPKNALYAQYRWTFGIAAPPQLSNPSPAANATVTDAMTPVSIAVADNSGVASATISIGGTAVPTTLSGGRASFTPNTLFPVDTPIAVTVSATDLSGNVANSSWSFTVHPIATFSGEQPAPGSFTGARPVISVSVSDDVAISASSSMYVDGVQVTPQIDGAGTNAATLSYTPPSDLLDGGHTVVVRVLDAKGDTTSDTWSFTAGVAPGLTSPSPADGSTVYTTSPPISVAVAGATNVSTCSATVNGVAATAVYDRPTGRVQVTPALPLPDNADTVVSVSAIDGAPDPATLTWSFHVAVPVTQWSGDSPAAGTTVTVASPAISVAVSSSAVVDKVVMRVDGAVVPAVVSYPVDNRHARVSYPSSNLGDGSHIVSLDASTVVGARATHEWSFGVSVPPTLGEKTPAPESVVTTLAPALTVGATDNSAVTTWRVLVNGDEVDATYDPGAKLLRASPGGLTDDSTVTVSATVSDALGNPASTSWRFHILTKPDMPDEALACTDCHVGFPANHPYAAAGCNSCHYPDVVTRIPGCSAFNDEHACHSDPHAGRTAASEYHRSDVTQCTPCHVSSLTVEHNRVTSSGTQLTCSTCHRSTDTTVTAAVAAGRTDCVACHGSGVTSGHADRHPDWGFSAECLGCHKPNVLAEHMQNPQTNPTPLTCQACHQSAKQDVQWAIFAGDQSCGACHQSAHDLALGGSMTGVPLYEGFAWSPPIDSSLYAGEPWLPLDFATGGNVVLSSRRTDVTGDQVAAFYAARLTSLGWTLASVPPASGATSFRETWTKASHTMYVFFYPGETYDIPAPPVSTGSRIQVLYK